MWVRARRRPLDRTGGQLSSFSGQLGGEGVSDNYWRCKSQWRKEQGRLILCRGNSTRKIQRMKKDSEVFEAGKQAPYLPVETRK